MKERIFGFIAAVMLATLVGWVIHPRAYADGSRQDPSANPVPHRSGETGAREPKLEDWPGCVSEGVRASYSYENEPGWISGPTFSILRDLLRAGLDSSRALCIIDTALVRSQNLPASPLAGHEAFTIAALTEALAYNWKAQGVLERADQLYERSYQLMQKTWPHNWATVWVLQDWALLKLERGQSERAEELASLQVALAREAHRASHSSNNILVRALTVHADILEKLGLASESRAARAEAQALMGE